MRRADLPALLAAGAPPPTQVTARHVQALRFDLRAETASHAAGLTAHYTAVVLFGSSKFLGRDELGHSRTTVGLTRSPAGSPSLLVPLILMVSSVWFKPSTATTSRRTAPPGPRIRRSIPSRTGPNTSWTPLNRWSLSPGALCRSQCESFPDASRHALRLTLRRRRLPHGDQQFVPDGSPVYPRVTGSQSLHCF